MINQEEICPKKLNRNEYQKLLKNLLLSHSWLNHIQSKFFEKFNISSQQFNVLLILKSLYPKPATVLEIQDNMLDKMSNVSRLLEKLRQKELIERRECPKNRRQVDVTLTETGLGLIDVIENEIDVLESHFNNISIEEAKIANSILDKLRN